MTPTGAACTFPCTARRRAPLPSERSCSRTSRPALIDAPVDEWAYEVDGEPVEDFQEFQKRLDAAVNVRAGEFVARVNGIIVSSA